MGLLNFFRRPQEDPEAARRDRLLRAGRIADGAIFDIHTDEGGDITHIFYKYEVGSVEYESSQPLDDEQRIRPDDYAPGSRVTVRFDPRSPANSVVV